MNKYILTLLFILSSVYSSQDIGDLDQNNLTSKSSYKLENQYTEEGKEDDDEQDKMSSQYVYVAPASIEPIVDHSMGGYAAQVANNIITIYSELLEIENQPNRIANPNFYNRSALEREYGVFPEPAYIYVDKPNMVSNFKYLFDDIFNKKEDFEKKNRETLEKELFIKINERKEIYILHTMYSITSSMFDFSELNEKDRITYNSLLFNNLIMQKKYRIHASMLMQMSINRKLIEFLSIVPNAFVYTDYKSLQEVDKIFNSEGSKYFFEKEMKYFNSSYKETGDMTKEEYLRKEDK